MNVLNFLNISFIQLVSYQYIHKQLFKNMEENLEIENSQSEEKMEILTEDLGQFLNYSDREKDGRQDGYFMHQSEYLSKKKVGFVSRFHKLSENRIDEFKEEKLKCET